MNTDKDSSRFLFPDQRLKIPPKAQAALTKTPDFSRPFYVVGFRYRSIRSLVGFVLSAAVVAITVFALFTHCPWPFIPIIVGLGFSYVSVLSLIGFILDLEQLSTIGPDGILMNRPLLPWTQKFIPWSQIVRFGAFKSLPGNVTLFFKTAPFTKRFRWLPSLPIPVDAYEMLVQDLRKEIGGHYPNLEIGGYEIPPARD